MSRRTLLVIASILCAALGTALIWLYAQGADARAQQGTALVRVVYFTGSATAGTPVGNLPLAFEEVPPTAARGVLTAVQQGDQRKLARPADAGQLLTPGMLTTGPVSDIPDGQGFVSLTINDPNRVPALLKSGRDVALYVLPGGGQDSGCARLLVPRVRVFTVGSGPTTITGQVPATIVGFLADPKTNAQIISAPVLGTPVLELLGNGATAARPVCR